MRLRSLATVGVLVVAASLPALRAAAQTAADAPRVAVTLAGSAAAVERATAAVRAALAERSVRVDFVVVEAIAPASVVAPPAVPDGAAALAWLDLSAGDVAVIYVADAPRARVVVRRAALAGAGESAFAAVGRLVAAAVGEILATASAPGSPSAAAAGEPALPAPAEVAPSADAAPPPEPVEPAPAPEAAPAPASGPVGAAAPETPRGRGAPASRPTRRAGAASAAATPAPAVPPPRTWQFGIGYGAGVWSGDRAPLHGVEAWFDLVFARVRLAPAIRVHFGFRLTDELEAGAVIADLSQTEARLIGSLELYRAPTLALRLGAGAGVDLLDIGPRFRDERSPPAGVALADARLVVVPVVRAVFELWIRLTGSIEVAVGAGIDAALTDIDFVIDGPAGRRSLFDPYSARPVLYAAIGWRLR